MKKLVLFYCLILSHSFTWGKTPTEFADEWIKECQFFCTKEEQLIAEFNQWSESDKQVILDRLVNVFGGTEWPLNDGAYLVLQELPLEATVRVNAPIQQFLKDKNRIKESISLLKKHEDKELLPTLQGLIRDKTIDRNDRNLILVTAYRLGDYKALKTLISESLYEDNVHIPSVLGEPRPSIWKDPKAKTIAEEELTDYISQPPVDVSKVVQMSAVFGFPQFVERIVGWALSETNNNALKNSLSNIINVINRHSKKFISTLTPVFSKLRKFFGDHNYGSEFDFVREFYLSNAPKEELGVFAKEFVGKLKNDPNRASNVTYLRSFPPIPEIMQGIIDILADIPLTSNGGNAELFQVFEEQRDKLSQEEKARWDEELRQKKPLQARNKDACKMICGFVDTVASWAPVGNFISSGYSHFPLNLLQEETANQLLGLLFLAKAAPLCPKAETLMNRWAERFEGVQWKARDNMASTRYLKESLKTLEANSSLQDLAGLKNAEAFLASFDNQSGQVLQPFTLYGKIYLNLLMDDFLERQVGNARVLTKTLKESNTRLSQDIALFEQSIRLEVVGSIFNTYGLSAAALGNNAHTSAALERLREMRTRSGATNVSYVPTLVPETDTERASSGRAITFNLALYMHSQSANEKASRKKDVLEALRLHLKYSHSLRLHSLRPAIKSLTSSLGFNWHSGHDQLAPYYYFPNVAYAGSAVRILLEDPSLTDEERTELEAIKSQIKGDISSMVTKENRVLASEGFGLTSTYYPAFAGLTLLPLVENCGGTPVKSYGIVSPTLLSRSLGEGERHQPPSSSPQPH